MGAWGAGLYQDDTACDVRDDYVKYLKSGLSDEQATRKILKQFGKLLRDVEIACLVYLPLAETQWQYGRVDPAIRKRALDLLRKGADLAVWLKDSPQSANARKKALATLQERLESKPKPRRKIKVEKPKPFKTWTDASLGTVFLLPLSKTTFAALVLIAHIQTGYRTLDPVFSVLKWKAKRAPTLAEAKGLKSVPVSDGSEFHAAIGFLKMDARVSPLIGLTRTDVVLPKFPAYERGGIFTNQEKLASYIVASLAGRHPKRLKWDPKRREWC